MKKIELVLVILFVASIILYKSELSGILPVIAFTGLLGGFYFYLSFFLLNDISMRGMSWDIFRRSPKYTIPAGFALGTSVSAIFCSVLHFPGSDVMLILAVIVLSIIALFARTRKDQSSKPTVGGTIRRCIVAIVADLLVWAIANC